MHLPVEFPLKEDGHRPVSETFRKASDELLLTTIKELKIPVHIVGGTLDERLDKISRIYNLDKVMPISQAIVLANEEIEQERINNEKVFSK